MPDGMARPYEAALGLRGIPLAERWSRRRLRLVSRAAGLLAPPARLLQGHLLHPPRSAGRGGRASAKRER
jgi:hypothetical protein